jgi:hypothetical protein
MAFLLPSRAGASTATAPAIEATLKRAVAALRDRQIPFLVGGGLASWVRGGPESRHDLDMVVKPEDAERALAGLADAGMRTERPPEEWLYKAWDGPVLVDVIFDPRGLEVNDELIERARSCTCSGSRCR